MRNPTRLAVAALTATSIIPLALLSGATPAGAATAPTLPQKPAAKHAAAWLAGQVNSSGFVPSPTPGGGADLSFTAQAALGLAAVGTADTTAHDAAVRALHYLAHHLDAYVQENGVDAPGQLSILILAAQKAGLDPHHFGKSDLVQRLLATMRTSGHKKGLFGAQSPTYDGAYRQGLALTALALAGVTGDPVRPAVRWLQAQQCSNGGWESYRSSVSTPCTPTDPNSFSGPDTNSTALAVTGLVTQGATFHSPLGFLEHLQDTDAGWGAFGPPSDPDSTALVIASLVAEKVPVAAAPFAHGSNDPVSALLSFRVAHGAFAFSVGGSPNLLATAQAIPALEREALP